VHTSLVLAVALVSVFRFYIKKKKGPFMPKGNIVISFGRFLVNTPQGHELVLFFQMYLITQHTLMNVLMEMI